MSTVVTLGPVGFKPTGAYDNTREYKKLDVVIYQGSSYIAKSDSIGQLPTNTTYWEMLVQKGDTGNGITSIAKTGTSGLVDTYTITYTDETTSTFTVTNGEKGDPGEVTEEQLDEAMARANMVYNALPKVSDEGDSLTLDGTANCPMKMELKGNTEQTTYTGNNLINFPYYETTKTVNGITFTVKNDGTIHVQGTASARVEFLIRNRDINLNIVEGETYTLATSGLGIIDNTLWLDTYGQTGNFLNNWSLPQTEAYTSAVAQSKDTKPLLRIVVANGATVNSDVKVWLYKGSYDETTTYEPFVGGYPSPSPDYPQDVRVVTGNNTIKVISSNNILQEVYPINLGTIELCKIGTYQDYIYKDNGKWYKHSEIGKVVLDGSEAWDNTYGTNLFTLNAYFNNKHFIVGYGLSNYYNYNSIQSGINAGTINGEFVLQKSNVDYSIHIKNTTYSTPADFKTWLSTHNTIVYYPLETPTNEEITDTTLISQLNNLENAVSYDTQTNIVQENYSEPFIINAECVRSLKDIFELIQ